jgi:hypothetical protein
VATQADARRAEINRERRRRPISILALRLAELNRLLTDRHGGEVLADDDAGREDAVIVAHHLAGCAGDQSKKIAAWIALRAPWMAAEEAEGIIAAAIAKPRRWRADTLAKRLNLTEADRRRLRIRTIGACDCTKENRAAACREKKRLRDRERGRQKRRAAGVKSRADYLASALTTIKPWMAEGISRRTWERRRRRAPGAGPPSNNACQYMQRECCDRRAS